MKREWCKPRTARKLRMRYGVTEDQLKVWLDWGLAREVRRHCTQGVKRYQVLGLNHPEDIPTIERQVGVFVALSGAA